MRNLPVFTSRLLLITLVGAQSFAAPAPAGFPFTDEALKFSLNMPGGPRLGDAHLTSRKSDTGWSFELGMDAPVPLFEVHDIYTAKANADFCSAEFTKKFQHGKRKGGELEEVDRAHGTVTRTTLNGGGKSEFSIPECTRDALTLLMYTRREMGQGRVPKSQRVLFGSMYDAQLVYTGTENVQNGGKTEVTDKVVCTLKGPKSNVQIEILFARDAARTPLVMRLPLAIGSFSLELVR